MKIEDLTYEQCVVQGIGPLVFPKRLAQPLSGSLLKEGEESQLRAQMKAVCVQNMQMQTKMQRVLEQAWKALEDAGIHAVLMKGWGLAQYYPSPEQRQWGDIDIYVGPEQYHAACAAMRSVWPEVPKFDEELEHYKHYNLIADGVSIELHRVTMVLNHPKDAKRYARMEREGMSATELLNERPTDSMSVTKSLNDVQYRVPETTYNALYVFLHSWEHMIGYSANLRQLCDLAFLLHHEKGKIDKVRLKRWLKELKLTEVWQLYMYIAVHSIGLPEDEAPLYNPSEEIRERSEKLLNERFMGNGERLKWRGEKPTNRWARKIYTMRKRWWIAEQIARYNPSYARHMKAAVLLKGLRRMFAKDRRWE